MPPQKVAVCQWRANLQARTAVDSSTSTAHYVGFTNKNRSHAHAGLLGEDRKNRGKSKGWHVPVAKEEKKTALIGMI